MRQKLGPALVLAAAALACRPVPVGTQSEPPNTTTTTAPDARDGSDARLVGLDERIERERERLGIPGLALVIVRDGEVVHARGFGARERGDKRPVDADTLFAIGSTTKAFTAMLAMMAVESGALRLDASPRSCLPGFKLADAEHDAAVTVRDLLTHASGLPSADLAWATGALDAEQLVSLMAEIEPTAPVRTRFQYSNLGYVAAGLCAARALGDDYATALRSRILAPIGMGDATLRVAEVLARPNAAHGHHRDPGGDVREVPMRVLDGIAPAGGLNASAQMLGGWLQLLLGQGQRGGVRLLSAASFEELVRPQFSAGGGLDYGLGWLRTQWKGHAMLSHTGSIDGFSALVSFVPERGIGFALLTNVDHADIHGFVTHEVLGLLDPAPAPHARLALRTADLGSYGHLGGFRVEVLGNGDRMSLRVEGQPPYPLEHEHDRRFRLGSPAPAGFFASFREDETGARSLLLEQPFGNVELPFIDPGALAAALVAEPPAALRELLGSYVAPDDATQFEVIAREGQIVLSIPGQPPHPIAADGDDRLGLVGLPSTFWLTVERDRSKRVAALVLHQPELTLRLRQIGSSAPPAVTLAELLARRAKAHGSPALARHRNLRIRAELDFAQQGVTALATTLRAAPNQWLDEVRLSALGVDLGHVRLGFDGRAWQSVSFDPAGRLGENGARAIALEAGFDPYPAALAPFAAGAIWRSGTIDGREVVVARFTTEWGAVMIDSYDAKTYLLRRREFDLPADDGARLNETRDYGDWRRHAGVMIPHRVQVQSVQGRVDARVTDVAFDVELAADAFAPPPAAAVGGAAR